MLKGANEDIELSRCLLPGKSWLNSSNMIISSFLCTNRPMHLATLFIYLFIYLSGSLFIYLFIYLFMY